MFFSYPSKDIKTKYSYEHVHRVLIKDRINKNASFSQSRPAEQSLVLICECQPENNR